MPEAAPQVFISFAYQDGLTRARELQARLRQEGIVSWFEPESMRGGEPWKRQILDALRLDSLRFLLLILTPATLHSEWVPWEWKNARSLGKHVVPVLPEEPGLKPDLKQFPRWIREHNHWKDPSDRALMIAHLKSPPAPPRAIPFRVLDKPPTYVQREKEYGELRDLLLDKKHENPVAITTAIHGGGGFGKTTLAEALCHDEQIYDAFTDGIVWVDLGPDVGEGKVLAGLRTLYEAFTARPATFTLMGDGARELREELTNRRTAALIVIDDVWHRWQLDLFLQGGPECARLFTTRQATIAADVKAAEVPVEEMTDSESIALLRNQLAEEHRGAADDRSLSRLATRVGEMAIMLELVGKQLNDVLRRKKSFGEALRLLEEILDRKQIAFFQRDGGVRREDSIARTIEASLEFLAEPGDRERALELGIFPAETEVPLTTVARLWQLDHFNTELVAERLDKLALIKLSATAIRMHDVLRRYFFEKYTERSSPAVLHVRLIDGWGDLHRLPDVYAWRHLAHHLIEAGRKDRLRELMLEYRWLRAKLRATDAIALRDDAVRFPDDPDLRYLARALGQSAHVLARDGSALRSQLYGRLMGIESAGIQRLVEQIGRSAEEGPWLRTLRPSLTQADSPLLRVLEGHWNDVYAVAVAPDGRIAVSGSHDCTVRVWDLATGDARTLEGHANAVLAVAVTLDGRTAVSGSSDRTVRVWDLAIGEARTLEGHGDSVYAVAVTPDGRTAVSGSRDRTVRVWDLATGEGRTLEGHGGSVNAVAVTSDGRTAVSGSGDGAMRVWDLATGQARALEGHGSYVHAVAVTPDGRTAVSGSYEGRVWVWDLATGEARTLGGHSSWVHAVAVTSDGRTAVSGSDDGAMRVWDLATGQARTLEGHGSPVHAVAVTSDGRTAVSGSHDCTVRVWDLAARQARAPAGHGGSVRAVALTPDGRTAVSGSDDLEVRVWDLGTGEARTLEGHGKWLFAVAVTSDGRTAVSGWGDGAMRVWDLATGQARTLEGHGSYVSAAAVTPDGRTAVSGSYDGTVSVRDPATGVARTLEGHGGQVNAVAVTHDGRTAVSGSHDRTVRVWDLATGVARTLEGHGDRVLAVALTPDGRTAVSGSADRTVGVWDLATGEAWTGSGDGLVYAVALTPDGRTAVSGSDNRTIRLWDLTTGQVRATFRADAEVTSCAVSDDGRILAVGDTSGRMHFLRLEDGRVAAGGPANSGFATKGSLG